MFGGVVLPSGTATGSGRARGSSLGSRSSCAASFGGILSTNAGDKAHGRRHGSLERLPKESYAEALREQIAGHAALAGAAAQREPSMEQDPFIGAAADARRALALSSCKGGSVGKEAYAAQLREQIAVRDARRAAEGAPGRAPSPARGAPGGEAAAAPRGRRCLPPPLPSRESYAAALEEQIAAREATRQTSTASPPLGPAGPSAVMLSQPEKAQGRRVVGPLEFHDKGAYASELRDQMVARSLRSAADRAFSQEPPRGGLETNLAGSEWQARGKRQAPQMPDNTKETLGRALQEQMADRAARRASGAFHLQAPEDPPVPERQTKGKRQAASSEPPPSQEAYASALRDQMREHRMRRAAQLATDFTAPTGGAVFGGGAAWREASPSAARGRRHSSQIELPTKKALGSALRDQMAGRGQPHACETMEPVIQDSLGPARATPPRAPGSSRPPTYEETGEPMLQAEALEAGSPPLESAAPGAGREALGASTRLGRSGACVVSGAGAGAGAAGGLSATEARRIRFADECAGAADGPERTLAARVVDERAQELRRLLDGGGPPGLAA